MSATVCPECGRCSSRFLSMPELAGRFPKEDHARVGKATQRARGRRIARDLDLAVIVADGIEFVEEAQLAHVEGRKAVAA